MGLIGSEFYHLCANISIRIYKTLSIDIRETKTDNFNVMAPYVIVQFWRGQKKRHSGQRLKLLERNGVANQNDARILNIWSRLYFTLDVSSRSSAVHLISIILQNTLPRNRNLRYKADGWIKPKSS